MVSFFLTNALTSFSVQIQSEYLKWFAYSFATITLYQYQLGDPVISSLKQWDDTQTLTNSAVFFLSLVKLLAWSFQVG